MELPRCLTEASIIERAVFLLINQCKVSPRSCVPISGRKMRGRSREAPIASKFRHDGEHCREPSDLCSPIAGSLVVRAGRSLQFFDRNAGHDGATRESRSRYRKTTRPSTAHTPRPSGSTTSGLISASTSRSASAFPIAAMHRIASTRAPTS
jgi:hypothetical protein